MLDTNTLALAIENEFGTLFNEDFDILGLEIDNFKTTDNALLDAFRQVVAVMEYEGQTITSISDVTTYITTQNIDADFYNTEHARIASPKFSQEINEQIDWMEELYA